MSTPRRTYWHLESLGHRPSDYEVATSRLLYHPQRGFEVATPVAQRYARHTAGAPLGRITPDRFADPRATTYASYTRLQAEREAWLAGVRRSAEQTERDRALSPQWLARLGLLLPPARFPVHALMMAVAYLGQAAPCGRVTAACAFQAGDELRRVHHLAERMAELARLAPGFGADARQRWQADAAWQPLRALLERHLVTWDFGAALVGLQRVIKPALDHLLGEALAVEARTAGDEITEKLALAWTEDAAWHRQWSAAYVDAALAEHPEDGAAVEAAVQALWPALTEAIGALSPLWSDAGVAARALEHAARACGRESNS